MIKRSMVLGDCTGLMSNVEPQDSPTPTERALPPAEDVLGHKPGALDWPLLFALGYLSDAPTNQVDLEQMTRGERVERVERAEIDRCTQAFEQFCCTPESLRKPR